MSAPRTMEFIGVTTSRSSILGLFPLWAAALGLEAPRLVGRDLPLDADQARYLEAVEHIAANPTVHGALITSHKVGVFAAAESRFDELDRYASLCHEISCISKRDGKLIGHAKDPVTAGRALCALLGTGYFARTDGHVLCFGAGGAGLAIAVYLLERPCRADRPTRLVVTDSRPERLAELRTIHEQMGSASVTLECVCSKEPTSASTLVADLPPGSLVINATGMGKDRPGSPLDESARFPERAVVWDLNYRGELRFLHQGSRQAEQSGLRVADGWLYFLHGWSEHIAEVFDLKLTPDTFRKLKAIADKWRAGSQT